MVSHQLEHLPSVVDCPICDQEEKSRVATVYGLPDDPLEWGEDVGATHVSSHSLNAITGYGQALLQERVIGREDISQGHLVVRRQSPLGNESFCSPG